MRSAILAFAGGIILLQFQAALPAPWAIWLLLFCGLLLLFATPVLRSYSKILALLGAGFVLGFSWAALLAEQRLQQTLPPEWEGRDITLIGTVDSLPDHFSQGVRFHFRVERSFAQAGLSPPVPEKIALSWYAPSRNDAAQEANPTVRGPTARGAIEPGERWQFTVRLRRPHGNANPHGFDYEVWLLEQNLRATGYVRAAPEARRLDSFVTSPGNLVQRSRSWLRSRILAALPDAPYAGVIVALVVGDQKLLNQEDWKVFNRSGIGHLISISGLHITMIAGLAAALMSALWRRSFFTGASLPLLLPAQKAAAAAGALAALLYVLLAGFGVPAQRTLYMVTVVAAALWSGRITSISHVLCLALGVVLLLDPWAVLWPGFWLSFGAVAILLFASVGRARPMIGDGATRWQGWRRSLAEAAHLQYAITLGLVPLSVLLFGQISLISPFANAIAIPLVSFVVTPLALIGSVLPAPLAGWVLGAAALVIEWLAMGLTELSAMPAAVWRAPAPPFWIFAGAMAGTLWLLAPRGWPYRWLGLLALLPLIVNTSTRPAPGQLWLTAFDVGQGTAVLIETAQHRLLYDTGPSYSPEADGASRVVLPYLRARGIRALDGLIISHNDSDHAGGALSLFKEMPVGWVASSLAQDSAVVLAAPHHRPCVAGQAWRMDEVQFEMLHPTPESYANPDLKPNARSCVLKITLGKQVVLLTGDIEAAQEAQLVRRYGEQLRAAVLLAPHHGSGTSSTPDFLAQVRPGIAIFQVGYRNRYRHPKAAVFDRYGELGVRRLRSDTAGAVTLKIDETIAVEEYRQAFPRYWHLPRVP